MTTWTLQQAVEICRRIEAICPPHGCHVALTGGTLYQFDERKDLDLLFYRIRQVPAIDLPSLFDSLASIGMEIESGFGWCYKATFEGKSVDIFVPEENAVIIDSTISPPALAQYS